MTASDNNTSGVVRTTRTTIQELLITIVSSFKIYLSRIELSETDSITMGWEDIAADKRSRISKSIPSDWVVQDAPKDDSMFDFPRTSGLLSAQELEWTNASATELVAKLAKGELKSVDLTLAFCKRAALAQQLVSFGARCRAFLLCDTGS